MEPVFTLLCPGDYAVTRWSGGTTTQLAIAPAGADYAGRDFLWRASSATVDLDESDFTALPDYRRFITTLSGDMTLSHNGGAELTLRPGDVHEFDGADETHSRGRCTDFNLMLRKGRADGGMCLLRPGASPVPLAYGDGAEEALLYCVSGGCTVQCGGREIALAAGESLRVEPGVALRLSGAPETLVACAWMRRL